MRTVTPKPQKDIRKDLCEDIPVYEFQNIEGKLITALLWICLLCLTNTCFIILGDLGNSFNTHLYIYFIQMPIVPAKIVH